MGRKGARIGILILALALLGAAAQVGREEFDALKAEVAELRDLLDTTRRTNTYLLKRVSQLEKQVRDLTPEQTTEPPDIKDQPVRAHKKQVKVRAWITGRSQIVICGDALRWVHRSYDRPGYGPGISKPHPTFVNGRPWTPTWQGEESAPIKLPFALPVETAGVKVGVREVQVPGIVKTSQGKNDVAVTFSTRKHRGAWFEVVITLEYEA